MICEKRPTFSSDSAAISLLCFAIFHLKFLCWACVSVDVIRRAEPNWHLIQLPHTVRCRSSSMINGWFEHFWSIVWLTLFHAHREYLFASKFTDGLHVVKLFLVLIFGYTFRAANWILSLAIWLDFYCHSNSDSFVLHAFYGCFLIVAGL